MNQDSVRSSHSTNTVVVTPYTSTNFDNLSASQRSNVKRSRGVAIKYPLCRTRKTVSLLLSSVVFLVVLCACLVASLVLVGRHVMATVVAGHNSRLLLNGRGLDGVNVTDNERIVSSLFRLPTDTRPIHYDITLMPDLQNASFKGKIKIHLELSAERKNIVLHSYKLLINKIWVENIFFNSDYTAAATTNPPIKTSSNELNINQAYFRTSGNDSAEQPTTQFQYVEEDNLTSNITVSTFELAEEWETLTIHLKEKLAKGLYNVYIEFEGDMKDKLVGLHYIEYTAEINGTKETEKRSIATTKFEPTFARQAYPCFDEPNMKATYKVHLLKPKGGEYIALSNMPQESEEDTNDGIMVHFMTSERMSTYLACFIVGMFDSTETEFGMPDQKKPLRVFATPGQKKKTEYALKTGKAIMNFYLQYFDVPYPLPKLDMIAIPDFVSGAMENWGLITYRETSLLYDEKTSSADNKANVASVIAHELAHSWFGNYVTMNWWDDLWLNEGFASYIEYKGVESIEPNWQMMDQFLFATLHVVLVLDATTASHPIIQAADTPNQITAMFDTISYKKGSSILRMLEDAITPVKFKLGVTMYLKKNKFGNAVTEDFWTEMTAVAGGKDISAIMKTWTTQMGYPIVTVSKSGSKYILKQEWYLTNSESAPVNKSDYKWTIPITYITNKISASKTQLIWFMKDQDQLEIDMPDVTWVKFNVNQIGYYRINYPEADWKKFATTLANDPTIFNVSDRANLLEESFRLAASGHVSYTIALDLSKYLLKENNFVCWSVASTLLVQLKTYLFRFTSNEDYQNYVVSLLKNIVESLGWEEQEKENDLQKLLRIVVLSLACSMGDVNCLNEAQQKFSNWLVSGVELSQNLKELVYRYGTQQAKKGEWYQVLKKFKNEADANEKGRLLSGLSQVKDSELLQSLILFAQDRKNIRDQDYFSCMAMISGNPGGTALVWNYVRSNWSSIVARFGLNERNLGRMIPQITKTFSTEIALEEMHTFFTNNADAGAGAAARLEAIETVKNNINWANKYETVVSQWILANKAANKAAN